MDDDGDRRSKVQRLYDACDAVFSPGKKGGLPTLAQIRWLRGILDGMEAADVGIDAGAGGEEGEMRSSSSSSDDEASPMAAARRLLSTRGFTRITYVHIHECDDFSMGVFCFPAGATLPLHDHPHMVVLSKLLYGSMRVSSYDWVTAPRSRSGPRKGGLAKVVAVDELREAPCRASVLFPRSGGNIHTLTAATPCALLDVLAPPYAEDLGRPSTFSDMPVPSLSGFAVLEQAELPEDFRVAGAPYVGPELVVSSKKGPELVVDMDLYD
ncbi:plant cysteine oxidase 1 [Panicum miliaceum]|uniref:cysteine dioxygenase n=1 Tax=Panicum miliaceum TaxID=4540 RepID=A0A3L6TDR0_PANMI|nr:plant cysteine oxidase 1 [Panicum miliaceum]